MKHRIAPQIKLPNTYAPPAARSGAYPGEPVDSMFNYYPDKHKPAGHSGPRQTATLPETNNVAVALPRQTGGSAG